MKREDVCLHGGHIMQRVAQDAQILVRRRKEGRAQIPSQQKSVCAMEMRTMQHLDAHGRPLSEINL